MNLLRVAAVLKVYMYVSFEMILEVKASHSAEKHKGNFILPFKDVEIWEKEKIITQKCSAHVEKLIGSTASHAKVFREQFDMCLKKLIDELLEKERLDARPTAKFFIVRHAKQIQEVNRKMSGECYTKVVSPLDASSAQYATSFRYQFDMCQQKLLLQKDTLVQNSQFYGVSKVVSMPTEVKYPYKKEYKTVTVNPHNFSFILQPEPCQKENTVLVTVHSATQNLRRRLALRNTWTNPGIFSKLLPDGYHVKVIFILGLSNSTAHSMLTNYEGEMYKDILQVDFIDSYHNNTYKAIYNMKWISGYSGCPEAKLVIKADDDVMINHLKFGSFWKTFSQQLRYNFNLEPYFIAGNLFKGGPIRNLNSKWYLSRRVYKYDTYPYWFQGMIYFFSPRLAKRIYELSFTTPYMFTDDVYIGIVADRVENIARYNLQVFYTHEETPFSQQIDHWKSTKHQLIYHSHSVQQMYQLWRLFCNYESCMLSRAMPSSIVKGVSKVEDDDA